MGQFSTYRLYKISSPPPKPHPQPQFPVFGDKLRHSNRRIKVISSRPHPKNGADGCEQLPGWQGMDSSLFPFASCAFQAPCWAPNKRLLHSGPIPYSHPPTARSQVPLHLLPTHKAQLPKRVPGRGATRVKNHSPPSQGVKMALTLPSPHQELPFGSPPPQRALVKACVSGFTYNAVA